MKNTINISLGGIVFHVEEDAHQKLSAYLNAISASMAGSDGQTEIMADIEARIAELLQPKISDFKQVVTITDIEEVISIMGNPEEFGTGATGAKQETPYTTNEKGRSQYGHRRIFRDPDDKVLGGVCSGLAYHFGIDPIWLRLAFGISIFLGGFGFILYILLLIIIPKAQTAAEKLEMRGQPVDINNIRKIIEEDMNDFKNKAKNFGNDVKNWGSRARGGSGFDRNMSDFFSSIFHGAGSLIGGIVKAILAVIGVILIVSLACLLLGLVVSLFTGMNIIHIEAHDGHTVNYSIHSFFNLLNINGFERGMLLTGIFLFIGIPLLALIVRFSRAIAGRKRPIQWFTVTASILWTFAWIFLIIGIAKVSEHFKTTAHTSDQTAFSIPASAKTLYLQMPGWNEDENISISIDSSSFFVSDDDVLNGSPSLCIATSPDSNFHMVLNKSARGENAEAAGNATNAIQYSFVQHDSVLQINPFFQFPEDKPWRMQEVAMILEVPVNKTIDMPAGIDHIMCSHIHHQHRHMAAHKWTMTIDGLKEALK
jgi:phage shock protein PspC (stress-responsive transcriptional regulator)